MNLLILAAGQGVRLKENFDNMPKSLVPIFDSKTYLSYQLEAFSHFKFDKRIVVGGYSFDQLNAFIKNQVQDPYLVLENKAFTKGNLYTLLCAQKELAEGFIMFNADHFYSMENYKKIFNEPRQAITVFCDRDRILTHDDMKVELDQSNQLVQMSKTLENFQLGYVGVTNVPQNQLKVYWEACQKTQEIYGDKANVESVINILAQNGEAINIVDISGSWWTEIDTPEDYKKACEIIKQNTL